MGHGYRPLICKIEIKSPNKKGTKIANRNLLNYIATREGVDLTRVNTLLDAVNENCDLTEKGEAEIATAAPDDEYLKYMTFRPRSHGLFGNIDTENFSEVSKLLDVASNSKKVIYRGVISLSELDGKALGYTNSEKWYTYLRSVMPDIAATLGLSPNNVTWVAAFHGEQSHPHVHFMLWSNKDQVKNAFITRSEQHKCREICQNAMFTDENEAIIKEITEAERKEQYQIQNASRSEITEFFKKTFDELEAVPGVVVDDMPGKLSREEHNKLNSLYKNILDTMPGHGRINYKFMPQECKAYIDQVTEIFLKRPEIKAEYNSYINAVNEIHKLLGKTKIEIESQRLSAINELYSRTGNIVLKGVLKLRDSILNPEGSNEENAFYQEIEGINHDMSTTDMSNMPSETSAEMVDDIDILLGRDNDLYNPALAEKIILGRLQENEDEELQLLLGKMYSDQNSILKDYDRAIDYLEEYVQSNSKSYEAYSILGRIYSDKNYDGLDFQKAEAFYKKAIEINPQKTILKLRLSRIYADRSSDLLDFQKAQDVLQGVSDYAGSVSLQQGNIYVAVGNEAEAIEKYKVGAEKGNAYAAFQLGRIFSNKYSVNYNLPEAVKYLNQAIGKVPEANLFLGKIYMSEASMLDYKKAENYFRAVLTRIEEKESKKYYVLSDHEQDIKSTIYFRLGNIFANEEAPQYNIGMAVEYYEKSIATSRESSWINISSRIKLANIYATPGYEYYDYQKAIDMLEETPDDSGRVALQLGKMYVDENSSVFDLSRAEQYFRNVVENSESEKMYKSDAFYRLGIIYSNEDAELYNIEVAVHCFEQSIATSEENSWSDVCSRMKLAKIYTNQDYEYRDYQRAINLLESVQDGSGRTALQLGKIFMDENNPNFHLGRAEGYLRQVAESPDADNICKSDAFFRLGNIYADENAALYNLGAAARCYEQGIATSEENSWSDVCSRMKLAQIYANREYEQHSYQRAISLLENPEDSSGRITLQLGKLFMDEKNPHFDLGRAIEYFCQVTDSPDADNICKSDAFFRLGNIYADENAALYNLGAAARCYEQGIATSEENSWSDVCSRMKLAKIYANPEYEQHNYQRAIELLMNIGDRNGWRDLQLGNIFANENTEVYNMQRAAECFREAAMRNNTVAMVKLANCYLYGMGVERDKDTAKSWLTRAAEQGDEYARDYMRRIEANEFRGYSYMMLRQVFSSMQQTRAQKTAQLHNMSFRTNSKQARKESYIHRN